MYKKTASFRCAGCRSAMRDGRAPEFKPDYLSGKIDFVAKTVRFKRDPDEEPHCCERRHPHWVKGKQLRFNVRNDKKETGATGSECIQALNKEVRDKEEDGDHDGVMFHIGKTETLKRQFKRYTKPVHVQNCEAADIDEDLQKSTFSDGSNIVRINDKDFVFLMEDKGIEIRDTGNSMVLMNDYLRSQYGEILKRRKPKYVESERNFIKINFINDLLHHQFVNNLHLNVLI